ncbi:MAG TPA: hypothetical protein VKA48_01420 [Gammaproteobacteria bacterium]|nr:hypothetical protein [Gammaproteobacteria bacterium]
MSIVHHVDELEKALALDGGHTLGDVIQLALERKAQVWESERAVIVTQIHDAPRQRTLHFWLAAGELADVVELSHEVLEWGRAVGCQRATLAGRKGWERVLETEGWSYELTILGRDLGGEGHGKDEREPDGHADA